MNPEAGLLESPFREEVARIARAHPKLTSAAVHARAREILAGVTPATLPPEPQPQSRPRVQSAQQTEFALS